jgi:hypothetical protein
MLSLARTLIDYEADLLAAIAELWDIDLSSSEQIAMADELARAMTEPGILDDVLLLLSDDDLEAIHALQAQDGRMPLSHFVRLYGEIRPMGPARRARERPWREPISITEKLFYYGLVARAFDQALAGAQEYIYIPEDLLALLPPVAPEAARKPPGYPVSPPRRLKGGRDIAPDDLATLLAFLRIHPTDARPWLYPDPQPRIDQHMRRPDDPAYRTLLTHLAYALGLIEDEAGAGLVATDIVADTARPWLEAPRWHQLRSLAEAWRELTTWNDLAHTPGLEAETWPNDPLASREAILGALALVPVEIWWSLDAFIAFVKEEMPDFQRPGGDYSAWYIHDAYTGEVLHGLQYWDYIEGALIRFVIEGPMSWLGLTEAARGAFRLTRLGLALLGREEWPSEQDPETRITVDPRGLISIPATASRYQRYQIARFSSWLPAPPPNVGEDEGKYLYQLTARALERARDQGLRLQQHIIPFLQRLSAHSLSNNVMAMLEEWEELPDQVVVHDAVVLEAKDLGIDERIKANAQIRQWLGRQLGPHTYMVARRHLPSLLNALREMGIMPRIRGVGDEEEL